MRVWGYADPRLLNRQHLLGEHGEIHVLNKLENGPGPEWTRFWEDTHGKSCLLLRHELCRVEMNWRWQGHHTRENHPTPVRYDLMLPLHKAVLIKYIARLRAMRDNAQHTEAVWFRKLMVKAKFPRTLLEGEADTPWDRDSMLLRTYLEIGDDWRRQKHHYKPGKWKPGRRL